MSDRTIITAAPAPYRKRPVTIHAMRFDGTNTAAISEWTGGLFADVAPPDRAENPEIIAEVWDRIHSTWVGVRRGDWIIRGIQGEFYPCDPDVFEQTYESAGEP